MKNCDLKCGYYNDMGDTEEWWWKKGKEPKPNYTTNNYLEVFVDDEATTLEQLNRLCGTKHDILFGAKIWKKKCM
jgi:hypothetical protein